MLLREQIRKGASDKERATTSSRATAISCCCARRSNRNPAAMGAPLIALAGGALALWAAYRRRRVPRAAALSEAERAKLGRWGLRGRTRGEVSRGTILRFAC